MDIKDERDGEDTRSYILDGSPEVEAREIRKFIEEIDALYGDYVLGEEFDWLNHLLDEDETEDNEDDE